MNIDWSNLTFAYTKTNTIVCASYKNGEWSSVESRKSDEISMNSYSASLHYGVECFEGLKAFNGKDGKIRIFRPDENFKRMKSSADYLGIECPSEEMFLDMVIRAVKENREFIPPYESRASLYIRPLLISLAPQLGVNSPSDSFFSIMVSPVGAYAGGLDNAAKGVIARQFDRAAPNGSGRFKVGGNYACSLYAGRQAAKEGYNAVLYLDPASHKFIDEFSSSNFFGIKGNTYVTPKSESVLPSITNKSLEQVAKDNGMTVERRQIPIEELASFEEVGECGTAVVITPVGQIDDKPSIEGKITKSYFYGDKNHCGPKSRKLYETITGIQYGEIEDKHGWCTIL
ncbi:MAG: branched-chain amino acid aminotransferase [Bacteroidales bacterium]|jgi:branched-chain amino acid aminotransferase|nr:branched-chain amino acid aminotransferase [Bacteroidales bacterium]